MSHLHAPPYVAKSLALTLGERQELLAEALVELLKFAWARDYQVRIGEVERDARVAQLNANLGTGIKKSLHLDRLAVDLHLFKDGRYLSATADHLILGQFWEQLHPLCAWGGRFNDGNHYSITYQGRR